MTVSKTYFRFYETFLIEIKKPLLKSVSKNEQQLIISQRQAMIRDEVIRGKNIEIAGHLY